MDTRVSPPPDDQQEFVDAVETWVEKELRPVARKYDLADEYPHDIVEQMKELGLFGATIGEEYGGLGLSAWTYAQIVIKVAGGLDGAVGHLQLAPDRGVGDRAQWHRRAEAKISAEDGNRRAARQHRLDRTECGLRPAGDPHDGKTRRRRLRRQRQQDVDHQQHVRPLHVAAGEDRSGGAAAPQGDESADRRKGSGLQVVNKLKKMGYRSIDTCEINFDNYRVSKDNLLGGVEGKGFIQTAGGLELGRINVAARGTGIAEGALKLSLRYAQERSAFGKPIWQHQAVQMKLADMVTQVEGVEAADRAGSAQIRPRRALRSGSGDGKTRGFGSRRLLRAGRHAHFRRLQLFG